jgi:hypothetical protein
MAPRRPLSESPGFARIRRELESLRLDGIPDAPYLDTLIPKGGFKGPYEDDDDYDDYTTVRYSHSDVRELYLELGMNYDEDFGGHHNIQPVPYAPRPPFVGPNQSSRLVAHQFIADQDATDLVKILQSVSSGTLSSQMYGTIVTGSVYVKWKKPSRSTGTAYWEYGPGVSLETYREFAKSPSKGQYVKQLESYGHGASSPSGLKI